MTHTLLNSEVLASIQDYELDALVVRQVVENEILEALMIGVRYNQSKAAKAYGVSRGTLRTLLKERFGSKYVGSRS